MIWSASSVRPAVSQKRITHGSPPPVAVAFADGAKVGTDNGIGLLQFLCLVQTGFR